MEINKDKIKEIQEEYVSPISISYITDNIANCITEQVDNWIAGKVSYELNLDINKEELAKVLNDSEYEFDKGIYKGYLIASKTFFDRGYVAGKADAIDTIVKLIRENKTRQDEFEKEYAKLEEAYNEKYSNVKAE